MLSGFVRICVKECDLEMLCVSLVSAIVVARWAGPQYIITDQEAAIRKRCGIEGLVYINMPALKFEYEYHFNQRSNSRFRLQVKEDIWRLIEKNQPSRTDYLLYADSDIVFTSCLVPRILLPKVGHQLALFPDNFC